MRLNVIAAGILLAFPPAHVGAQEVRYRGICDASAAVALGADHFVVGEDERETLLIYKRGDPDAKGKVPLCAYLGGREWSDNGDVKCIYPPDIEGADDLQETDIEGAARIGNLVYWILSHSRNKDAEVQEPRRRFFATEVVQSSDPPTLKPLATPPYRFLLNDLLLEEKLQDLKLSKAAEKAPEEKDGFNIEGLAATPNGQLLIGFRNPIRKGKALVIPLTNPEAVVRNGSKPEFGDAILLDLETRGIRSIELVGNRYLIIAGPHDDDAALGFALYSWDGPGGKAPEKVSAALGDLHPEAIFAGPGGTVDILSDDGDKKVGGKKCKKAPVADKTFRATTVKLP